MRMTAAIVLLGAGASFGAPGAAAPATLTPFLDTYVSSASPDMSFGNALYLSVENATGLEERSYLKFDVSSLAGTTVSSATLRVWVIRENSGGGAPDVFELYPVHTAWDNGLTYNQSTALTQGALVASTASQDYGTTNTTTPPQAVDFDVTTLVQSWASGSANHGLVIRFPTTANADMRFATADDADPSIRPSLTVAASAPSAPAPSPSPAPAPPASGGSSASEGENGDSGINDKCGGTAFPGGPAALLAALLAVGLAMRTRR